MQHLIVTTANGHEAYFQDTRLVHFSTPEDEEFSARMEGWAAAAEDKVKPARVHLTRYTGNAEPDWDAVIKDIVHMNPGSYPDQHPDPSCLMNHHHDHDGQYGM